MSLSFFKGRTLTTLCAARALTSIISPGLNGLGFWPAFRAGLETRLILSKPGRMKMPERFTQASTRASIRADLNLIDAYDAQIDEVERTVLKNAKINDPVTLKLLRTIPGIGKILSLVLLYEIDQIARFPEVGNFLSYSRLVRCEHESAGKKTGSGGKKIGNAHLKWEFSEAACLMLRAEADAKKWLDRQARKRGKKKALSVLEAKLGRAVYHVWSKQQAFDLRRFFA